MKRSIERRIETLEEIALAFINGMVGKKRITNLQLLDLRRTLELDREMLKPEVDPREVDPTESGYAKLSRAEAKLKRRQRQREHEKVSD